MSSSRDDSKNHWWDDGKVRWKKEESQYRVCKWASIYCKQLGFTSAGDLKIDNKIKVPRVVKSTEGLYLQQHGWTKWALC